MNSKTFLTTLQVFAGALHTTVTKEDLKVGNLELRGDITFDQIENKQKHVHVAIEEMKDAHIFELEDSTIKMLALTDIPKDLNTNEIKFPFDKIFLDAEISKENFFDIKDDVIHGLYARIDTVIDKDNKILGREIRYFNASQNADKIWVNTGSFQLENNGLLAEDPHDIKDGNHKILKNLIFNFILFLNNPEIQIVEVTRTKDMNEKRIKKGKIPLPSSSKIYLTGTLKEYIDKMQSNGDFNFSHKFWVRGHWRTLRDINRWKEKTGTRIWILPYIKGQGILIDKVYKLEKK